MINNYYDWYSKVKDMIPENMRIDDDLFILEDSDYGDSVNVPRKVDVVTFILMDKGHSRTIVDGKEYSLVAPNVAVILPNQTYCLLEYSEDIKSRIIIMSPKFTDGLLSSNLYKMILDNPVVNISADLASFNTYYKVLLNTVKSPFKRFRFEAAKHLTISMLYFYARKLEDVSNERKKNELIFEHFVNDVRDYHKMNRSVPFYSGRLAITPRKLTEVVKEKTGMTASDYIDKQTIIECQALLTSTDMTIQQISRLMMFPSYSVFGKYFKRITGMSPTEYREKIK